MAVTGYLGYYWLLLVSGNYKLLMLMVTAGPLVNVSFLFLPF